MSVRKHISSTNLDIPEARALIGKDVRVILIEECSSTGDRDLSALDLIAGKIDLEFAPKPLVLIIEYHSADAPTVDNRVLVTHASLYLASGVSADGVYGISDMQRAGAAYVQIANRLDKSDVESLASTLADTLSLRGIRAEVTCMYDE